MTISEVLDDFPDMVVDDIQACFAYAKHFGNRN